MHSRGIRGTQRGSSGEGDGWEGSEGRGGEGRGGSALIFYLEGKQRRRIDQGARLVAVDGRKYHMPRFSRMERTVGSRAQVFLVPLPVSLVTNISG